MHYSQNSEPVRPATPPSEGGKKQSRSTGMPGVILAIVCLVIEAIIFILTVIGTPIDAFKGKGQYSPFCFSMWGYKRCGAHKSNPGGLQYKGFPTKSIERTMNAAAAFSIISIFFTLIALVLTVLLVCKCIFRVIPGIFSIISFVTLLIVWACQAGAFHKKFYVADSGVPSYKLSQLFRYAGSFGLFVTAWCLQTIEMVLVFFA